MLEAIYNKSGAFKHPKVFQCDNRFEFKVGVTKFLETHNVDIQRATTKFKEFMENIQAMDQQHSTHRVQTTFKVQTHKTVHNYTQNH